MSNVLSFCALQISFEQIYYAFAGKLDKIFWARLKEKSFAIARKWLRNMQSGKTLCVHCPKTLNGSTSQVLKVSIERNQCWFRNVIDWLSVATNQSIYYRMEYMLRLIIRKIALIRVPIAHMAYWPASTYEKVWTEQRVRVLEFNVLPHFPAIKHLMPNMRSIQSTTFCFWPSKSFQLLKHEYFVPLPYWIGKFKDLTLKNIEIFNI